MSGYDLTGPVVLLGTLTGLGYALLAVGLVLTYRSSRVINFAHGAVGLFVAGLFAVVVGRYGVPYGLGFPAALLCGALVGADCRCPHGSYPCRPQRAGGARVYRNWRRRPS